MADRSVKRAKEKLMSRRQDNERAARREAGCRLRKLSSILSDMLEDVQVEYCAKFSGRRELVEGADDDTAGGRQLTIRDPPRKAGGKRCVGSRHTQSLIPGLNRNGR